MSNDNNQQQPIPPSFENWISEWLKKNVVSAPEDWQMHNAKVTWCRAIAIDAYRKLSQEIDELKKYKDKYLSLCQESASKCPEDIHPVAQSAWMDGFEKGKLSQQQAPGMRWVKPLQEKDRPAPFKNVIVRSLLTGGVKLTSNMSHSGGWDIALDHTFKWDNTEYLEETPSAPPIQTDAPIKSSEHKGFYCHDKDHGVSEEKCISQCEDCGGKPTEPSLDLSDKADAPISDRKLLDPWFILKYVKTVLEMDFPIEDIIGLIAKKLHEHSSEILPAQSPDLSDKEAPEEIMQWIKNWCRKEGVNTPHKGVAGQIAIAMYHKMQEQIKEIKEVTRSISDSYNEMFPKQVKLNAQLAAARQEASVFRKALEEIKHLRVHQVGSAQIVAENALNKYPSPTNNQDKE